MRILVLPLALIFAACLYLPFPKAAERLADTVKRLYLRFLAPFTRKSGRRDETLALVLFMLLAGGVALMIGIQVVLNVAVVTSSMPPTGIALPFVSYGGNALWIFMGMAGVVLNISRQSRTLNPEQKKKKQNRVQRVRERERERRERESLI